MKFLSITDQQKLEKAQVNYERANRSRFVGGGFGARGAVKGMLMAGSLNIAKSSFHSIFDSMEDSSIRKKYHRELNNLYRDPNIQKGLAEACRKDIIVMYDIFLENFMYRYPNIPINYTMESVLKAASILINIEGGLISEQNIEDAYLDALAIFPPIIVTNYKDIFYKTSISIDDMIKLGYCYEHGKEMEDFVNEEYLAYDTFDDNSLAKLDENIYFDVTKSVLNESVTFIATTCVAYVQYRKMSNSYLNQLYTFDDGDNYVLAKTLASKFGMEDDETLILFINTYPLDKYEGVVLTDKRLYASQDKNIFNVDTIERIYTDKWSIYVDDVRINRAHDRNDQAEMLTFLVQLLQQRKGNLKLPESPEKSNVVVSDDAMPLQKVASKKLSNKDICINLDNIYFRDMKAFKNTYGSYFTVNTVLDDTQKKHLQKIINNFAPIGNDEFIYFFVDNTFFQSGKEGFAITNKYLYANSKFGKGALPLSDIKSFGKSENLIPHFLLNDEIHLPSKTIEEDAKDVLSVVFMDVIRYIMSNS